MYANDSLFLWVLAAWLVWWVLLTAVGLAATQRLRAGRAVEQVVELRGRVPEIAHDVHVALAALPNATLERRGDHGFTISFRVLPEWAVGIAAVSFPIGLLALAIRQDVSAVTEVTASELDGISRLTLQGRFSTCALDRITTIIDLHS